MLKFLLIILLFFLLLFILLGFSLFRTVKKVLFGSTSSTKTRTQPRNTYGKEKQDQKETTSYTAKVKKKIFSREEGEYVEYEEVDEIEENKTSK